MFFNEKGLLNQYYLHNDGKGNWQSFEAMWLDEYGHQEFIGYGADAEEAKLELIKEVQKKKVDLERILGNLAL